MILGRRFWMP